MNVFSILTLGPNGSNSHVAAIEYGKRIGISDIILLDKSNYEVIKKVSDNYRKYLGLVAIENTKGGLVQDSIEALDVYRPKINGEYILPIIHCLAWKDKWEKVREIHSHSQALRQCPRYLREKVSSYELKEAKSTSHAAELASQNPEIAAICTKLATEIYELPNVIEGIQDSKNNETRFISISNTDCENITGDDKTTLRYEVEDKPAALWNAMGVWARKGLNLSMQHSIPTGNKLGEYYMITEVEAHRLEPTMRRALEELREWTLEGSIYVYGSYPAHRRVI